MHISRRNFIRSSVFYSIFIPLKGFAIDKILKKPYMIEIEIPRSNHHFFTQSESSDVDIKKINDLYLEQGKIVSIEVDQKVDSVLYRYTFNTYQNYREWNDLVYHRNLSFKAKLAQNKAKFFKYF